MGKGLAMASVELVPVLVTMNPKCLYHWGRRSSYVTTDDCAKNEKASERAYSHARTVTETVSAHAFVLAFKTKHLGLFAFGRF